MRGLFLEAMCDGFAHGGGCKLAIEWYRAGIALDQVHGAMLLGCARKYVSKFNHAAGSPITSLQYFGGILLEAGEMDADLNYWRHLADRVCKMETHWRAHAKFASAEAAKLQEPK